MAQVEMFFDHTCPYCLRGFKYLLELLPKYPNVEILWRPVEAHPKIEEPEHLPYQDLAVQGALFIREAGGDERAYNERIFKAYFEEKLAPDDIAVLTKCAVEIGTDGAAFEAALRSGSFEKAGHAANDYAYEEKNVWAVPTFVCGEKRLDAVPGVGVTSDQLEALLADVSK